MCICVYVWCESVHLHVCTCTCSRMDSDFIYKESPLLEGQCRHRSMQILHHLSLHIGYIGCTYYLAPLPVSCNIFPLQLSSPSFSLPLLHSLQSAVFIFSSHLNPLNENILTDSTWKKKRRDHQSLSGPEIIFLSCHDLNEYGFMAPEMWNTSYWDCKCT